tara:strand:- start:72 stop:443 length:372 start_codon:yes stop_codon:yes gene_type:complete
MPYGKKSPAEMGHKSPMKKESAKQEKKNLMQDMPIDDKASALEMGYKMSAMKMNHEAPLKMAHGSPMEMGASWMSKHSQSALHMGHSPAEMGHDSPAKNHHYGKRKPSAMKMDHDSPAKKHCM